MQKDQIFANPLSEVLDFQFDEQVVNVFPDMIKRSVPGYSTIISQIAPIARRYAQPYSRCYDLGCSLGASTLMLQQGIHVPGCRIIAVDNSPSMINKCQSILDRSQSHHADTTTELICQDIQTLEITHASVITLNFTLQFIEPEQRAPLIQSIYDGLLPGGVLILSEKIHHLQQEHNQWLIDRHHDFKFQNGYSELEISQKRSAIENVLITDTLDAHRDRLEGAGFQQVYPWFQCFNFVSLFAVKPAC